MVGISAETKKELERCVASPEEAHTLPAVCYVDPEIYEIEQNLLFRSGWVGLGRSDRWKNPGDYSAFEIGGVPVVVTRDENKKLRAFANTCRHRSSQIMTGEGTCSRFRCRFHFWTYALDGRLIGAPSMHKTPGFEQEDFGLKEFALEETHGFVLLSLEENPTDLHTWLGDFEDVHAPWPAEELITTRRREFIVDCNWKAFAEVFNEYYHLPYVHPVSIGTTYNEPDEAEEVNGAFATHFGTTEGTGGLLDEQQGTGQELPVMETLTGRLRSGVRYSWMFPNIVTAFGSDAMWMYEIYPDSADRSICAMTVCFPQSTIDEEDFEEKSEIYYERFEAALEEDIPMLEQQHAGMKSPFAQQGRYSYLEPSVARFASWYAQSLLAN